MKKTLAILLSLALMICMIPATAATAFGDEKTEIKAADVTLSPESALYTGGQHKISEGKVSVTVKKDSENALTKDRDYTVAWSKDGVSDATPKEAGIYTLTVTGMGNYTGTVTKTYTIKQVNLDTATIECPTLKASDFADSTWTSIVANNTVTLPSEKNITVKIGSEVVSSSIYDAVITKVDDYQIQVKVSPKSGQNSNNITGTKYATFNVTTELTDSAYKVVGTNGAAIPAATYTGYALTPAVYVVPDGTTVDLSKRLTEGTDYKVSYSNNICGNSDATVTITGMNRYSGTVTGTFHINGKSISGCTINVGNTVQGAAPAVTVYDGSKKLTEGTDYEAIDAANYNTNSVGSNAGTVTITGKGNYEGTKTTTFKVVAAANNVGNMKVYQGSNQLSSTSNLSGTYNYYTGSSLPVSGITVYTSYPGSTLSTYNYDVVYEYTDANGNTVSTTAPVNAKTYAVYVVGKNDYAGKQQIGAYTILPHKMSKYDLNISVSMASAAAEPAVTVRSAYYTNTVFTKGTDYTVYASSYTYNGKRTVTISSNGTGNLASGSISESYPVVSKSISSCTVSFKDGKTSAAYTGYTIPVQIVVKDGYYTTLTENQQYTVTYKNEAGKTVSSIKDAGRYTIEITGKNGYTGTTYLYFTVTGNDISTYTVVLNKTSIDATGYSVTLPKVTKVYSGSTTLSSSNYTVSYQNAAGTTVTSAYAPGTYKVAVTGTGKYSGTAYATFTIVGKNQTMTGVESTYKVYPTSDAFKLSPKATEGTFTYTSSDSTVATVSSTGVVTPLKAGRAKITIKTTGNTKYNPAEFSTVIKVYPTKAVITQKPWTTGKSKIKVRWNKQDNVTRYEIRYSRVKSFASGTYITKKVDAAQNDYTTQSTTIKNLKSGQKYYVKVRAVKEVYNDYGKKLTYYGAWSGWRSVKVQ